VGNDRLAQQPATAGTVQTKMQSTSCTEEGQAGTWKISFTLYMLLEPTNLLQTTHTESTTI
jgi:hypothetical protein